MESDNPLLEEKVEEFVAARDPKAPIASQKNLAPLVNSLNKMFWEEVDTVLHEVCRAMRDRLIFNKYQRMLADTGFLDPRLIGETGEKVQNELVKELYAEGGDHQYYFSQWLAERFNNHLVLHRLQSAEEEEEAAPQLGTVDPKTVVPKELRETRVKIYKVLGPLFENLPGFKPQVVALVVSGQIDERIEGLTAAAAHGNEDAESQWQKLQDVRSRILSKVSDRATDDKHRALLDALGKIDTRIQGLLLEAAEKAGGEATELRKAKARDSDAGEMSFKERRAFLLGETKLVRSLLQLGTAGAGLTKTYSVLLSDGERTTLQDVREIYDEVMIADPYLPSDPNIVIAPYIGTGFYEWDRDTVFIPILATMGKDEAIVNGLAQYRILIDALHNEHQIMRSYEIRVQKGNFRENFLKDYKAWVMSVCKGYRGKMEKANYDFFRARIGPNPDSVIGPRELLHASSQEETNRIKECRGRVNRQEAEFDDYYSLAVLYWKSRKIHDALPLLAQAVKLNPTDGRAMFSLGVLCSKLGIYDKARDALKECLNIAPNTLWHVYAKEELAKLA